MFSAEFVLLRATLLRNRIYYTVVIVVLYVLHSSKLVRNKTRLSCLMAIRPTSTSYLLYINLLYAAQEERPNVYPTDFDFLTPGF